MDADMLNRRSEDRPPLSLSLSLLIFQGANVPSAPSGSATAFENFFIVTYENNEKNIIFIQKFRNSDLGRPDVYIGPYSDLDRNRYSDRCSKSVRGGNFMFTNLSLTDHMKAVNTSITDPKQFTTQDGNTSKKIRSCHDFKWCW